jgi:Uma2 family endonuclease
MPRTAPPFENVGEMLERLGNIDPRRIRSWPPPGQATEKDVLKILNREDRLYELVDGVLVEKVMGFTESALAAEIVRRVGNFVEAGDLGVVAGADGTVRLMPRLVRIPDVSFVSWDKLPGKVCPAEPIPDLVPDLAVEVLSEGNTEAEMERKFKDYFFVGIRLVWLVDPRDRTAQVYTTPERSTLLTESQALDGGDVLPGFTLPLSQLFARVPRPATTPKQGRRAGDRRKPRRDGKQR